jgi:hypothetical protein
MCVALDVLAGGLMGIGIGTLIILAYCRWSDRRARRKEWSK